MRPLNIKPAREITELALAPDGQKFGVIQSYHGFRAYDAVTGAEFGDPPESGYSSARAPTGRHFLILLHAHIRLAEVTAGRPWVPFQTGWTRDGTLNRPPATPNTLALPSALQPDGAFAMVTIGAVVFDRWGRARGTAVTTSEFAFFTAALSADHRFAVGRLGLGDRRIAVCDLAREVLVASDLDLSAAPSDELVRVTFTPDSSRIIAVTRHTLFVFDRPPAAALGADDRPNDLPVLKPVAVVPVTQPQPDLYPLPPFAVLPCGQKVLMRGEKSRVELRDLTTGELLTAWKWLRKVNALAVAADGLTAAAGGANGRIVIWDLG